MKIENIAWVSVKRIKAGFMQKYFGQSFLKGFKTSN